MPLKRNLEITQSQSKMVMNGEEHHHPKDKIFYKILRRSYSSLPYFIPKDNLEFIQVFEKNWKVFREELEAFHEKGMMENVSNRTAYKYQPQGWKTITLMTYMYRYHHKCKDFPKTLTILEKIPGLSLVSINMLAPNAKIKGHYGDCDATYRCSLGLIVPEGLPRCGMRVGTEEKSWEEGKALVFVDANRHRVWNHTEQNRAVLVIDVFKSEYRDKMLGICGKVWASFLMIHLATRYPHLKKIPYFMTYFIHTALGLAMTVMIWLQRKFKFEMPLISG